MGAELPTGTVTFLFTDLEGSTRLWEEHPDAMDAALARHDEVLREAIAAHGGHIVKSSGDGFHAAFSFAHDALDAAVAAQRALAAESFAELGGLGVRMGVHTCEAECRGGDYYGSGVNRAARLMSVAHGGQIVCSAATADLARDRLAEGITFADLGEHRLRDLSRAERVFQVCAPGLRRDFPALASLDAFPGNLPLQVTSFIGREHEIDQTITALSEARVVTLTGVGGVGKTRLAFQVAAEMLPGFREGAWLVDLAPVRDPDAVVDSFTVLFGVTARAGQSMTEALVEFLGTKQLLLVVDNCEHVLDPVAELVDAITHACPGVVILTTSREVLTIPGERIIGVPPLPAPPADADMDMAGASAAVALFVDRAQATHAAFALTPANARSVVQVCRRLDGIPLAIELAAARVHVMSPAELASALDHRFDVLAGGRRGAIKRQQTLRATIDWSYDLLSVSQQRLLARLSVFAGGCTRDAAEVVCAGEPIEARSVFSLLTELVDRSLVNAEHTGPDTRYRLLETIRECAEERLAEHAETETLSNRHADYYTDLFCTLQFEEGFGPDEFQAQQRLFAESENFHLAMAWAVDTANIDLALTLLSSGGGYAFKFPVDVLAEAQATTHPLYPSALATAAVFAAIRGDLDATEQFCQRALAADARQGDPDRRVENVVSFTRQGDPDRRVEYVVSFARGVFWFSVGAFPEAAAHYERAADVGRSSGNHAWVAIGLGSAALFAMMGGDSDSAARLATEGFAAARECGSPGWIAQNQLALAGALADTDPPRAHALLHDTVTQRARLPYQHWVAAILVAARLGDLNVALELAPQSIRDLHWTGDRPQLAGIFNVVACGLLDRDPEAAAALQGAARTLASTSTAPTTTSGSTEVTQPGRSSTGGLIVDLRRQTTQRLRERLGDERLQQLRDHGAQMDIDHAVAYALDAIDRAT
jgi:predicted ATPase/class 3 adenylate cyclase